MDINTPNFTAFYNALTIPKPPIAQFAKMDLMFTLGVWIAFLRSQDIIVTVSTRGYKVRRHDTEVNANVEFITFHVYETNTEIMTVYKDALEKAIDILNNPF